MTLPAGPNRPGFPIAAVCRAQKGRHAKTGGARNTTHELMAFGGHKTLSDTSAADKKRLADSGAAKMGEARAAVPKWLTDQSADADCTNIEARLHKHEPKPLKMQS